MTIEIKHVLGRVLYTAESAVDVRAALVEAVGKSANLRGANLGGADLRGAYLYGSYLYGSDLRGSDLRGADLRGANLGGSNLYGANLRGADLRGANLGGSNLYGADLYGANLGGADLRAANLGGSDLRGADLRGANLRGANLRDAYLKGAKNAELAIAQTRILPEGDLVGYKKCSNGEIAKLRIPADAKRSNASGRKCRAEYAEVLEIVDAQGNPTDSAVSRHDNNFDYKVGHTVRPKEPFDEDPFSECASGIHWYITRVEAENG